MGIKEKNFATGNNVFSIIANSYKYFKTNARFIGDDKDPWFCGIDVATILGYNDPIEAIYDELDDKNIRIINGDSSKPENIYINEPGLYLLILGSDTEGAKKFMLKGVIPAVSSIMKHQ